MKKHYINQSNSLVTKNQTNEVRNKNGEEQLNQTAAELDTLAKMRLPDKVLQGVLAGFENDIRQDAIVLSLGWYLREKAIPENHTKYPWHAPRAIAAALRIQKRDYIKTLKGEAEALEAFSLEPSGTSYHPSQIRISEWTSVTMRTVIREAIGIALKKKQISAINAAVGIGLLIDGIPAKAMAAHLKVTRSAIYQHLGRVRRAIPDIIDGIEVPLHELL